MPVSVLQLNQSNPSPLPSSSAPSSSMKVSRGSSSCSGEDDVPTDNMNGNDKEKSILMTHENTEMCSERKNADIELREKERGKGNGIGKGGGREDEYTAPEDLLHVLEKV